MYEQREFLPILKQQVIGVPMNVEQNLLRYSEAGRPFGGMLLQEPVSSKTISRGGLNTLSVFDLDHTLVSCNSSFWFCKFLHKKKAFTTVALLKAYWYRLRHDFSSLELEQLHSELFKRLLQGLSMDLLESFVDFFMRECVLANLYFPAFQELRRAQHRGAYTVIMSSSPAFLVRRVAMELGVDEYFATEYLLDSSRCLVGIQSFIDGQAKAHALQNLAKVRNVPLNEVSAYSDSYRDLPFLSLVGLPVAVNPDPKLLAHGLEHKWRIL